MSKTMVFSKISSNVMANLFPLSRQTSNHRSQRAKQKKSESGFSFHQIVRARPHQLDPLLERSMIVV
jgi:hypothetical protein